MITCVFFLRLDLYKYHKTDTKLLCSKYSVIFKKNYLFNNDKTRKMANHFFKTAVGR